ncbi:MAG TPA: TRAP transporter substrate-binding protein [Alphaproteobacteria bacterium]|nr:TRAP transporter substrate-binding protein [Alphaproteobacteria bacterium]
MLRFNRWLPPKYFFNTEIMEKWVNDVKTVTQGRVQIVFTTKSLGPPQRQFDLARDGVADLAWGNPGYVGAPRFVLPQIAELPMTGESGEALSVAYWRTHVKYFHKAREYRGTKVIAVHTHAKGGIFTTGKAIRSIADLKGMKIRVPNPTTSRLLQNFGGVPISATVSKAYEMLSKGVIDGTFFSTDSIVSFRLASFIKNATHVDGGFFNASFFLVMNQGKWDALSKSDQAAIERVSGERFAALAGSVWDQKARAAAVTLKKAGMVTHTLSAADRAELAKQAMAIETAWIAAASKKGVDAKAALKYYRAQAAAYKPMKK